ncbi:uncharacterized protein LOC143146203 isoform X2 [Ptiloglossa arizonensis]|uniref:uncharacterized protein LOC143146203 isoform X2 n=1 Tax=Ptiloglossa arizonensis TaxID=3350558 RepID=UPI003F9EF6C1
MPLTRIRSVRVLSTILAHFSNLSLRKMFGSAIMLPRYVHLVLVYHAVTGLSLPTSYDQRQTGDLNVQVHLKDVQVLALLDTELLDDYTEYDYFYDYADFTVKPIVKPTTSSASTESTTPVSSSETEEEANAAETSDSVQNSTLVAEVDASLNANTTVDDVNVSSSVVPEKPNETPSIEKPDDSIDKNATLKARINDKTGNNFQVDEDPAEQSISVSSINNTTRKLTKRRCRSGYSPDGKGRCRRLSQRQLSFIPRNKADLQGKVSRYRSL